MASVSLDHSHGGWNGHDIDIPHTESASTALPWNEQRGIHHLLAITTSPQTTPRPGNDSVGSAWILNCSKSNFVKSAASLGNDRDAKRN